MKPASDGKPLCGSFANELGVRPKVDITPDDTGRVHPHTGGMSTTPDNPAWLPPHVRPASFGGKGRLPIFVIELPCLTESLALRRDPRNPLKHAFIEPAAAMLLSDLQAHLCNSRTAWQEAEL